MHATLLKRRHMARYLVTGGAGFIGSHLVESLLADGHAVHILDDLSSGKTENVASGATLIEGDVADPASVHDAVQNMDGVFHLAARASVTETIERWGACHRVNLTGTINVLAAASTPTNGPPIPVVYASSAAVYGPIETFPTPESARPAPLSPYGADKLGSEQHAAVATHLHGTPTTGLRFFNVYGPRQDPSSPYSGVISIFAKRVRAKQPLTIYGDGGQSRDFVFVTDVVRFLRASMDRTNGGAAVYNIGTGHETTVQQLATMLGDICGAVPEIGFEAARSGDIRRSVADVTKATSELGVQNETNLRDGLVSTLAWMAEA